MILISGNPGTGKTLLQNILSNGLRTGHVDTLNVNFPLEHCYQAQCINWDEGHIPFQLCNLYKTVLQGTGYIIQRKGKPAVIQSNWVPVIITTNQKSFPEGINTIDKAAIRQRCTEIKIPTRWYSAHEDEIDQLDIQEVRQLLCNKWLPELVTIPYEDSETLPSISPSTSFPPTAQRNLTSFLKQ